MYSNVAQRGNYLYVRGSDNGRRFKTKIEFSPTIWVSSKIKGAEDPWTTLDGQTVYSLQAGSIKETRDFVERYSDVHGMSVYESPGNVYQYIAETYTGELDFSLKDLKITFVDIEVESERGFPNPVTASEKILLISLKDLGDDKIITWGVKPLQKIIPNVEYRYFPEEKDLLRDFLAYWQNNYPDILTGWNSTLFDVTYLYNRISLILGEKFADKLSPWGQVNQREVVTKFNNKALRTYISGVSLLDYMELYMKFGTYSAKESYKLEAICEEEIGVGKVKNPGASFQDFYTNHWETFVSYNVRDVTLVEALDNKMRLLELGITIAYSAKINFEDVFSPVKCWDMICYNYLNEQKMVVPMKNKNVKSGMYEGAYVKQPIDGRHYWCVSFDLTSLYPHIMMQNNMSPETICDMKIPTNVEALLNRATDLSEVYEADVAMAANGVCFRRDFKGLLPIQMERFFNLRTVYKKKMIEAKKAKERDGGDEWDREISRYDNLQQAMKILLNSMYGALGNVYSRYYDIRIAEGITLTGQLVIRWIANTLNAYMNKALQTEGVDYVLLIDTDSVVLNMGPLVAKMYPNHTKEETVDWLDKISQEVFQNVINKTVEELATYTNAYAQKMFMKRENIVDVMLSVSKKRYVMSVYDSEGVRYKTPKLKIMGLQIVKASTPAVVRRSLKESIPKILYGTEEDLQNYVEEQRNVFGRFSPEEIAFPRSVNNLAKYSDPKTIYRKGKGMGGCPIHVRAALLFNHMVRQKGLELKYPLIQEGNKMRFIYLRTPNPIGENCIGFVDELPPEFELVSYVDYDTMFVKTFEDAVQNFVQPIGWHTQSQPSLEEFFS